jgi:hypothetical protein
VAVAVAVAAAWAGQYCSSCFMLRLPAVGYFGCRANARLAKKITSVLSGSKATFRKCECAIDHLYRGASTLEIQSKQQE